MTNTLTPADIQGLIEQAADQTHPILTTDPVLRFAYMLSNRYATWSTSPARSHAALRADGELCGLALGFMVAAGATKLHEVSANAVIVHLRVVCGEFALCEPHTRGAELWDRWRIAQTYEVARRLRTIADEFPGGLS